MCSLPAVAYNARCRGVWFGLKRAISRIPGWNMPIIRQWKLTNPQPSPQCQIDASGSTRYTIWSSRHSFREKFSFLGPRAHNRAVKWVQFCEGSYYHQYSRELQHKIVLTILNLISTEGKRGGGGCQRWKKYFSFCEPYYRAQYFLSIFNHF